ncbi:unnamed protein product [Brachionus calyciflorus]|uniref:Uncharacterized protein n=1 Tax=Brachionus calyciflorus TaxID=104777 RepID=A0A813UXW0_9BILA|nr:unnamed protein product [Brachionus calyciflorus]
MATERLSIKDVSTRKKVTFSSDVKHIEYKYQLMQTPFKFPLNQDLYNRTLRISERTKRVLAIEAEKMKKADCVEQNLPYKLRKRQNQNKLTDSTNVKKTQKTKKTKPLRNKSAAKKSIQEKEN